MIDEPASPFPDNEPRMACAVCSAILDTVVDRVTGEVGHVHSASVELVGGDDHAPIAVDLTQVKVSQVCDFCFAVNPAWWIMAEDFQMPHLPPNHWSRGGWSACRDCARLLERDQWDRLKKRAIRSWERREGRYATSIDYKMMISDTYDRLREKAIGKPLPLR